MRGWRDVEDRPGLRNWPDAVTCPGCQRRFTPTGFPRHKCKSAPKPTPWRLCRHCGARFTSKGIARHELACSRHVCDSAPKPTPTRLCRHCGLRFGSKGIARHEMACSPLRLMHVCPLCDRVLGTKRGLIRHQAQHEVVRQPDERIVALRGVAEAGGWLVVDVDPVAVMVVRATDPVRVIHARIEGDNVVGRCVTRARLVGMDEPVALTLDLASFDDVRALLELAP